MNETSTYLKLPRNHTIGPVTRGRLKIIFNKLSGNFQLSLRLFSMKLQIIFSEFSDNFP